MAWEWGGIVGIDPTDRTLKELHWALTAKRKESWDHTAAVLFFSGKTSKAKHPDELNPFRAARKKAGMGELFAIGRQMYAEKKARTNGTPGA